MPGLVNLDFADIRTIMTKMGKAMMGTGEATGENRAILACEAAIANPLLDDISIKGAKGVLVNMTGGPDMTLFEADMAVNAIRKEVDQNANIIFGSAFSEDMKGKIRISVVATGIESEDIKKEFNKIEIGSWINVVRSSNPIQFLDFPMNGLEKYHSHTIINEKNGSFIPDLTFVYYIQMPNILKGDDGVLYILGDNQIEHKFLPEENDLIIMPGDLPHAPNNAPLSNIDRIVIAGNIGFQYIKKEKTLF